MAIDKTPVIMAGLVIFGCALVIANEAMKKKSVALAEGWNLVTYKGKELLAPAAFASLEGYLIIAYHLLPSAEWEQVIETTTMVPGDYYDINVSADCVWEF